MSKDLEIARKFVASLNSNNIDEAVEYLLDDAMMIAPIGAKMGKDQIRGALVMMKSMGDSQAEEPVEKDGEFISKLSSPMGDGAMIFVFEEGLIAELRAEIG